MQVAVERRPTLIFLIVLAVLLVLMTASTRTIRGVGETRTLFERTVMTLFSPVPKTVNRVGQNVSDAYHGYVDMRRSVAENVQLHRRLTELTTENLVLRQTHGDLSRMRALLNYSDQVSMPTVMAQAVMLDTGGRFKCVVIDRGSDEQVELNDPVVSATGLVGRVILTTKDLAKVQLVIDSNSAVGVLLERSRRQGIIKGDGRGMLTMQYVPAGTDVVVGDKVVTAGIDGIFPKGVPVARVTKVEEGKDLFKNVTCAPLADLSNLEELIVLRTRKVPDAVVRYGH
ncbi:MAG TPA: rod shape-determining protein MreC [Thermoanaerobaculia bacterium]|nr:rod shape-determining protein MreC [Thermoanaerobaculia bacterium]